MTSTSLSHYATFTLFIVLKPGNLLARSLYALSHDDARSLYALSHDDHNCTTLWYLFGIYRRCYTCIVSPPHRPRPRQEFAAPDNQQNDISYYVLSITYETKPLNIPPPPPPPSGSNFEKVHQYIRALCNVYTIYFFKARKIFSLGHYMHSPMMIITAQHCGIFLVYIEGVTHVLCRPLPAPGHDKNSPPLIINRMIFRITY